MSWFADATFFVALLNKDDAHHREALAEMAQIASGSWRAPPVIFTDYVFDEVVTTLLYRTRRHEVAARAGRMLLEGKGARMAIVSPQTFQDAWKLFQARPDKQWSFTDCTSFRVMEELGLDTALSFDSDFREAGFATLP